MQNLHVLSERLVKLICDADNCHTDIIHHHLSEIALNLEAKQHIQDAYDLAIELHKILKKKIHEKSPPKTEVTIFFG